MAEELGYAVMPIIPSLKGASGIISREMAASSQTAGVTAGRTLGASMTESAARETAARGSSVFAGLEKGAVVSGSGYGKRFGSAMHETIAEYAKGIGTMMVGFMAFEKVKEVIGETIKGGQELAQQQRLTESAIESTGGAAGVSATHVEELAKRLGDMAGVDDIDITKAENLMLTFREIKNVGPDKIFDDATEAAINMGSALAAASGGAVDYRSSVTLVGKALNDPIKGMTAMQRVGVSFTDQQREQVKTMVESGHTMDAQKLILKELETEYGGAAKSMRDPMKAAGADIAELEAEIGTKLIPVLGSLGQVGAKSTIGLIHGIGAIPGPLKLATAGWLTYVAAQRLGLTSSVASGLAMVQTRALGLGTSLRTLAADYRLVHTEGVVASRVPEGFIGPLTRTQKAVENVDTSFSRLRKTGALLATVAVATSGVADRVGLANTATLALAGSMVGPLGAATGVAVGGFLDARDAAGKLSAEIHELQSSGDVAKLTEDYAKLKSQVDSVTDAERDSATGAHGWGSVFHDVITQIGFGFKELVGGPSLKEQQSQLAQTKDRLDSLVGASYTAAAATGVFGKSEEAAAKKLLAANKAGGQAVTKFLDISAAAKTAKGSVSAFETQLETQAKAVREFGDNAYTAAQRGVKEGLIKQLAALGPQGAAILDKLAHGSRADIGSMNRDFATWTRASKSATAKVGAAIAGVTHPTWNVKLGVTGTTNVERAIAAIDSSIKRATSSLNVFNFSADHVHHPKTGSGSHSTGGGSKTAGRVLDDVPDASLTRGAIGDFRMVSSSQDLASTAARKTSEKSGKSEKHRERFTLADWKTAAHAFNLTSDMTVAGANKEINSFVYTIRRDGGHFHGSLTSLKSSVDSTVHSLRVNSKQIDALTSSRSSAISATSSAFTHDVFSGGLSDLTTGLTADKNDANAERRAIASILKKSPHTKAAADFISSLEQSGNVALAQQVAGSSSAYIRGLEKSFKARGNAVSAAANQAGAVYQPFIDHLKAHDKKFTVALNRLEAKIEHAVERGSENGTRKGNNDRDKRGANRRKTR